MRSRILLTVLVLCAASIPSYAGLLASFENVDDGFSNGGITGYSTTTGVTEGTYSAICPNPGGWGFRVTNTNGASFMPEMVANTQFSIDFTVMEDLSVDFQQIFIQIVGDGFTTYNSPYLSLTGNGATDTLVFDYSAITPNPAAGWANFKIGFNGSGASTIYMDNIVFTPEPATMSLLGLGAVALLRRKR